MNEQIKNLAERAAFRQFTMPKTNVSSALEAYKGMFTEQEAIEKFAELIIKKCISQIALIGISNFENEDISWTVETAIDKIQEHFGLKK